jgi:hypothetical protein
MPNRILRETLLTSRKAGKTSDAGFCLYIRLLLVVDDYGRFSADPVIVRSRAFPTREELKSVQVAKMLEELRSIGLIRTYQVGEEPYLEITNWSQRTRAQSSKYPAPTHDGHMTVTCQSNDGHMTDQGRTAAHGDEDVDEDEDEDEGGKRKPSPLKKKPHGQFNNVLLSQEEHMKIHVFRDEYIERLSEYLESSGKKYRSHYATILAWMRKDGVVNEPEARVHKEPERVHEPCEELVAFMEANRREATT